ncbi:DNA circularization N-terminal domain-containing protein [Pseudomonas sichuanensis]|uniref:DNA circularization protein n=1 Tax=Pseudomonas sichuanensis TaxID=2213015 RepID=UPI00215F8066|nr:DNA circularization N-terminal domain-containing protein [Pseudomonas sichuanensis]UVK81256.1 DNA circularization N-terminal domain-containing protein [Pseudomonas sichuanensis]
MSWRDKYRTASFRGVEFHVESAESAHGRRQAVHEHAQRDVPYTEDLGRKAREFSLTGYLVGKEYDLQRDRLIEVCEQAGPGALVHPYRGEMTVVCRGLTVSESSDDGGMCRLTFTFLESGEASYPSTSIDHVNAISAAGNQVIVEAEQGFLKEYVTEGYPAFVVESASARLAEFGEFLSSPGAALSDNLEAASAFYSKARAVTSGAYDLAMKPLRMADSVLDLVGSVRSAFGSSAFGVLTDLFDRYSTAFGGRASTASRQQQATNYNAMNALVRQAALAEAAQAAVVTETTVTLANGGTRPATADTEYDSHQQAVDTRDALVDRLDTEAESTQSDTAYIALSALRTEVVKAVPNPAQDLPRLVSYAPRQTLPSLLVAYQLYGDAARADEIARRNSPRNPGFLIGGQSLEIVANG